MHRYSHWNVWLWRRKIDQFTHNGKFLSTRPGHSQIYWGNSEKLGLFLQLSLIGSLALQLTANNGAFACRLTGIVQVLSSSSKRLSRVSLFEFWRDVTCPDWVRSGFCVPGRPLVDLGTNIQLSPRRTGEHTMAMCVCKQSYECLYRAGALLKWFLLYNMPAWRGNHIPGPIVTFITFHLQLHLQLQLPPFTAQARLVCQ